MQILMILFGESFFAKKNQYFLFSINLILKFRLKKKGSKCEDPLKIFIEFFFLYMYAFSIIWMCFMSLMFSAATEAEKENCFMKSFKKVNFLN
jgi:hypothetical protein